MIKNEPVKKAYKLGERNPCQLDDDIRRVMLGMLAVLKRKFPEDWRRMVRELNDLQTTT